MLIIVSLCLAFLVTATALTVDIGRLSARSRDVQAVADVLSLDLVRALGGRTAAAIVSDPAWADAIAASRDRNDFPAAAGRTVAVAIGRYDRRADEFTPSAPAEIPTAVRVTATDTVDFTFVHGSRHTARSAVAMQAAAAGFSVGAAGYALVPRDRAVVDAVLADAFGVDGIAYADVAGGQVGLALLADALGLDVARPTAWLGAASTLQDLIGAEAEALREAGDLPRAAILDQLATALPAPTLPIALGQLVTIEPGGADAAAAATLDGLRLLTAIGFAAGDRVLSAPDLGLDAPGLVWSAASVRVDAVPSFAFGPVGTRLPTAAATVLATLGLDATVLPGTTANLTATVSLAVGAGSTTVTTAACATPRVLDVAAETSPVEATVDLTGTISQGAPIADVDVGTATTVEPAGGTAAFSFPPDQWNASKRLGSGTGIGLRDAPAVRDGSALVGPEVIPLATLRDGAVALAEPALDALDAALGGPFAALLGLTISGADIAPVSIRCAGPRLAG